MTADRAREGFEPCPTCHQYSHSIGDDALADAFNHFQSMFSHRGDGFPTQFAFDQRTRDAAQVLIAALQSAEEVPAKSQGHEEDGWRPIETAPRDGSVFLARREGGDIGAVVVARTKAQWPGFHSVPGDYALKNPTHWRPLPAPPSRSGGGEGRG